MKFLEKLCKMLENIEIKICHNRKKKKLFRVRTKLSYCQVFRRNFFRNEIEMGSIKRIIKNS